MWTKWFSQDLPCQGPLSCDSRTSSNTGMLPFINDAETPMYMLSYHNHMIIKALKNVTQFVKLMMSTKKLYFGTKSSWLGLWMSNYMPQKCEGVIIYPCPFDIICHMPVALWWTEWDVAPVDLVSTGHGSRWGARPEKKRLICFDRLLSNWWLPCCFHGLCPGKPGSIAR